MAAGLSDFNSAAQLREIIRMYSAEVVSEDRPAVRFATVTAVHATLRQATCIYPGEVATFTIPYGSAQPIVGSMVRVAGRQGAKYIEDVIPTNTADVGDVPSGQKIYHRIAGQDILTIQNPNNPTTLGGYVMEMHPQYGGAYLTLHPAGWAATAYTLLNDATNTFLSASTAGSVYIRAGINDGSHQVQVHPAGVNVAGVFSANSDVSVAGALSVAGAGSVTGTFTGANYIRAEGSYVAADSDLYARNYNKQGHRIRIGYWTTDSNWTAYNGNCGYILMDHLTTTANAYVRAVGYLNLGGASGIRLEQGATCAGQFTAAGLTTIGGWSSDGAYSAIMGTYGYHLMGKGGADGAVHTRGNNAGWDHYIGAGSYINTENWVKLSAGPGTGGAIVYDGAGVLKANSSRRILKEQIEPLPEKVDAGAVIDALEPVTYIWRKKTDPVSQFYALKQAHMETPHDTDVDVDFIEVPEEYAVPHYDDDAAERWRKADLRIGLIADDVAEVSPELANWEWEKDENGKMTDELIPGSWNESAMIAVLLQGVKDLRIRVAELELSASEKRQ
jgi:hypothetical protein